MCIVSSFYRHKKRGTLFYRSLRRWYELDGFLMRQDQWHRHVRKVGTIQESSFSDHKPKMMEIVIYTKNGAGLEEQKEHLT